MRETAWICERLQEYLRENREGDAKRLEERASK